MKTAFLLPICLLATPLFSQKEKAGPAQIQHSALNNQHSKRAVVVGIGQYQDSAFVACEAARRDAEEYAAFLQSKPGGGMERDQILLLTDRDATLARFVAAIDWLLEETGGASPKPEPEPSGLNSKLLVYFAGAGQIIAPGNKKDEDAALFFHDSPPAPLQGNTFPLSEVEKLLRKNRAPFVLTASFRRPFLENEDIAAPPHPAPVWEAEGKTRHTLFFKKNIEKRPAPTGPTDGASIKPAAPTHEKTVSNQFVAALIGLADTDGDGNVSGHEAFVFLKDQPDGQFAPDAFFYTAVSPRDAFLSKVDERMLDDLRSLGGDELFPPIVHLESMPAEDRLLENTSPSVQRLYEDFILSIKVKNFIAPSAEWPGQAAGGGNNAAALCDSLLKMTELQPIAGQLRRRLAAAMLDDTQQALNAYLNNSAKEMARRRKNPEQYATYARMLGRADKLLGERHYMHKSLVAKQLYFDGLSARLFFLIKKDSSLLSVALEKQRAALQSEPEAAYILNELGVVHFILGDQGEARRQFLMATEFSPMWGIPFGNLSQLSIDEKNWATARELAIKAISLAPWNPDAYVRLGNICMESGELVRAEDLYLRAMRRDAEPAIPLYNLACIAARQGKNDEAFDRLRQALAHGFEDLSKLALDPDLDRLRGLPEWRALMEKHFSSQSKD